MALTLTQNPSASIGNIVTYDIADTEFQAFSVTNRVYFQDFFSPTPLPVGTTFEIVNGNNAGTYEITDSINISGAVYYDVTPDFTTAETYDAEVAVTQDYFSNWVAAHNPIIYKLTNTKFPTNTEDSTITVLSIDDNEGKVQITTDGKHGFVVGQYVTLSGASPLNGNHKVAEVNDYNILTLDLSYQAPTLSSAQIIKHYKNYHNVFDVYTGIPSGHILNSTRPIRYVGSLKVEPDLTGEALADIQGFAQQDVNAINDLDLGDLPNDTNRWTAFYISYKERWTDTEGEFGSALTISNVASNAGKLEIVMSADLTIIAGQYVTLAGFSDTDYNTTLRVIEVSAADTFTVNATHSALTVDGGQTIQFYSIDLGTKTDGETVDSSNVYYAVNAKLPLSSQYGNNLLPYLNTFDTVGDVPPFAALQTSFFNTVKYRIGVPHFDLTWFLTKEVSDAITTGSIVLEVTELDRNGNVLAIDETNITKKDEGVYRVPTSFNDGTAEFCGEIAGTQFYIVTPQGTPVSVIVGNQEYCLIGN